MQTHLSLYDISKLFDTIETLWAKKIGLRQDAMLPKDVIFRVLIAHFATCKIKGYGPHRDFLAGPACRMLLAFQIKKFQGLILDESGIVEYAKKIRQVNLKFPRYSWEWNYGRIVFETTVPPKGHSINPNVMEAVGLLILELSKYEYPKDFRKVLALSLQKREPFIPDKEDEKIEPPACFEEYYRSKRWGELERKLRYDNPQGTNVKVYSFYVSKREYLYEYFKQKKFRKKAYDKIIRYLIERPGIIIDLSFEKIMTTLKMNHGQLMSNMEMLAAAGVLGAKVRFYYVGPVTLYVLSGEMKAPWEKIRRRVTAALRNELLLRARRKCQILRCPFCQNKKIDERKLHVDHLMPFSIFKMAHIEPDANPENLRVLCAGLNRWKSDAGFIKLQALRPIPPPLLTKEEWEEVKKVEKAQ